MKTIQQIILDYLLFEEQAGPTTYTISGTVFDADGSTPVASATVAFGALSATSAADGTYTISNISAGTSGSMTCTKTGYSWTAITVAAMSGNLTAQNYTNAWWATGGIVASCQRAYRAIGAASQAASYVNLITPGTGNANPVVAPGWDVTNGWTAAANAFIKTGIIPTANTTFVIRLTGYNLVTNKWLAGCYQVPNFYGIVMLNNGIGFYNGNGTQNNYQPGAITSGVIALTSDAGYLNGSSVVATTAFSTSVREIGIFANNDGGGSGYAPIVANVQAVWIGNAKLTAPQVAALSTAMAALP